MVIVQVIYQVKAEFVEAFRAAVIENAHATVKEPGNLRFEVYQDADDPTQFILFEMFESPQARQLHFETPHLLKFRSVVGEMIVDRRVQTWLAVTPTVFTDKQ